MRRWRDREVFRHHRHHNWVFECLTCGAKTVSTDEDQVIAELGVHDCRGIRNTGGRD